MKATSTTIEEVVLGIDQSVQWCLFWQYCNVKWFIFHL